MSFNKLLIANRGEIAIRIARAAGETGLATVAIYPGDDALSLHVCAADAAHEIPGRGARAYLDIEAVIAAAKATGCDALHPGYGFLSENAGLARRCAEESIVFVGPSPEALDLFGDKGRAKALAKQCRVPIIEGTEGATSLDDVKAFFASLGEGAAVMIKAIAGGGGRGMRIVDDASKLEEAFARCQSEAKASFGSDGVYVERLIRNARHIEVQIIADHHGAISHLWERECTIQRRNQKLVEIAPSPSLNDRLRGRIIEAAKELAAAANYSSLGTFEFLVDNDARSDDKAFAFIEANPRLQVEHTVTEAVLGIDLVQAQLAVADGATLGSLGLAQGYIPRPRGYAIQLRVNMETMDASGATKPTGGTLSMFDLPSGPGVRVDTFGYSGYKTSAAFDSLLAKVIVHATGPNWTDVVQKAARALREFRIGGVATNIPFLGAVLAHPEFVANHISTGFVHGLHVDAKLHGIAARPRHIGLRQPERTERGAIGHGKLRPDQIDAEHFLGDGMFDLQPRIGLDEGEGRLVAVRIVIDQEFEGAEIVVVRGGRQLLGGLDDARPQRLAERGAWRNLDELLVAALDGAFALPEVADRAVAVADDLHLDMAGFADQPLGIDIAAAERGHCLGLAARIRLI